MFLLPRFEEGLWGFMMCGSGHQLPITVINASNLLQRVKVYLDSYFLSFRSMKSWPCCFWPCGRSTGGDESCSSESGQEAYNRNMNGEVLIMSIVLELPQVLRYGSFYIFVNSGSLRSSP